MHEQVDPIIEDEKIVKEEPAEKPPLEKQAAAADKPATVEKSVKAEKTEKAPTATEKTEKAPATTEKAEKSAATTEKAEKTSAEKAEKTPAATEKIEKTPVAKTPAASATAEKADKAAAVTDKADKAPAAKAPAATTKPAATAATAASGATAKRAATAVESKSEPDPFITRRRLIWASVVAFLSSVSLMCVRFFLPRTLFEPSPVFRIGYPSDFTIGVDTKFQAQYRIWVVRNAERLFVIYARCPHLGCTPDWKPGENKFKCPCHGSGYDSEGINFEGPAPRPMDRADVKVDAEGQIVVDTSKLYAWPKGSPSEFDKSGAFLKV